MAWFNFLKSEGYFDPEKNPSPIKVQEGYQTPYWESLRYLEKLSIQIKEGKEIELIDDLLSIIYDVSKHPKDNYRTWYNFIKILTNIPNERIPKDILHFIPVWLTGRFDTMLQTAGLCEKLLPKFLNDNPTPDDIEKAEIILYYLFYIEKKEGFTGITNDEQNKYTSKLYLHFLTDKFEKRNILSKIIKYCSLEFILTLGRTIKFLLLDYPKGIFSTLKDEEKEYEIGIFIEEENIVVSIELKESENTLSTKTILDWENKSENELRKEFISIFKNQNINYIPTDKYDDTFQKLNILVNTGANSLSGFNSIRKLNNRYSKRGNLLNTFCLIFRDLLDEMMKQKPNKGLEILKTLCYDNKYHIPFYKRITLFIISENWDSAKPLFFELIENAESLKLFTDYKYHNELYDLFSTNQYKLNATEIKTIDSLINQIKPEDSEEVESETKYLKLKWYSALKEIKPFDDKYSSLSKELNVTSKYFENFGEIRISSGSIPPISIDELLEKSNHEIVDLIKTFNPIRNFNAPNISGLSEVFGNAVGDEPEKFTSEIQLYKDIPYIYAYRMLNSFEKLWRDKKTFDWEKVLIYCLETLKSPKFYKNELIIENDGWGVTFDWVVGSIANLLTIGLHKDENSFDIELLPIAKEIIQIIVSNLKAVEDFEETNIDYPLYSLNSTAGKSLRALLDYSLNRARNLFQHEEKEKWEKDIKLLFENAKRARIIDASILEGMYFEQFCFLDYNWAIQQVKYHHSSKQKEWLAFMGGYVSGSAPNSKELYEVFYYHYEKIIDNNIKFEGNHNGLVRHLTAFYFWKYETIADEKLLFKFIRNASSEEVGELIHFIWEQENYPKTLSELAQKEFNQMILDLWKFLINKYKDSKIETEQDNIAMLCNWIVFAPQLDDIYTTLILESCKYVDKLYSIHLLLENLEKFITKSNLKKTAESIGKIIVLLSFDTYMVDNDENIIKNLVSFLFENEQREVAIDFCNKMASVHQHFFLREVYETYTK